ncbi:MAG: SDR family oxidoreductase [Lentisphaerae bacterium]|nr:SDR family oxidoreductase [Lentisphaerota bacterium]
MYLITGGCGFIGSHIAEALVARGDKVRIFDNLSSGYERNLDGIRQRVEFVRGDVRDTSALQQAMQGVRHVFHEAALVSVFDSVERPIDNHEINLTGTLNVLMAARQAGVRRLVVASSAAIYGNTPELPKREDMRPSPESPYGLAKLAKEHYFAVFAALYGLETVCLRYFNVYGPRQDPKSMYSGVISKFCDVLAAGQHPTVFGDGGQTRDFIFVKDIVAANLLAMDSPRVGHGEVFNVATGRQTSLLDLLKVLGELTGRQFETAFKPARAGDIRHSLADVSKARRELGFEAKYDIKDGLRLLLAAS